MKIFTLLTALITIAFGGADVLAARFYVKPLATGNGSGADWNNASANLQTIINGATFNDEIWVAFGMYKPNSLPGGSGASIGERDVAFVLKSGVKIYGGFFGNETLLSQRNVALYPTIFSGDIGTENDNSDNANHVVISVNCDENTLLDGVSITDGYANGLGSVFIDNQTITRTVGAGIFMRGSSLVLNDVKIYNNESTGSAGGVYIRNSQPTFNNAEIFANKSVVGGGIYAVGAADSVLTLTVQNSTFSNNIGSGSGGAINLNSYSTASFTDVTFSENAGTHGGALYSIGVSSSARNNLNLLRVTFSKNIGTATSAGGGAIYIHNRNNAVLDMVTFTENSAISGGALWVQGESTSSLTDIQLSNSTFTKNSATNGGGIYISANVNGTIENTSFTESIASNSGGGAYIVGSTVTIKNNHFNKNIAGGSGGGMYLNASISSTVQNNRFYENIATGAGGGVFLFGTATTNIINHSLFYANQAGHATLGGGGLYISNNAKPTVTNCTFYANYSKFGGGGIGLYTSNTTNAIIANCILYNNTSDDVAAPDIHKGALAVLTLASSITQQYSAGTALKVGENPLFASTDPETTNFLMLSLGSPAIDAGDNLYIAAGVSTDLAGKSRRYNDGTVDMGAFENQGIEPLPVVLIDFTAKSKLNHVLLEWSTASEINNAHFLIERSADGTQFSTLTTLSGKGTYSAKSNYNVLDQKPQAGLNYYRLKQVDFDGKVTSLGIKAVDFKFVKTFSAKLYPNPTMSGKVNVSFAGLGISKIEVINLNGTVLRKEIVMTGQLSHTIDLENLPPSTYLIRILDGNSHAQIYQIIKK